MCYVDTILSSHVSMTCIVSGGALNSTHSLTSSASTSEMTCIVSGGAVINSNKQIQYGASGVVGARRLHILQN